MRVLLVPLLLATLASCAPSTTAPEAVMAMVVNNTGVYEPTRVDLRTIRDVVALNGDAARLVGGARIVDNPEDPLIQAATTAEQLERAMVKSPGLAPRASYVDRDGVLWPADFHTWNMVTTYYNFERAFEYFQNIGITRGETLDPATGLGPTVYYFPSFTLAALSAQPLKDNALYYPPIAAFAVLPFDSLQSLPLSMNGGVVAHEFAHRVYNTRVYGRSPIPIPYSPRWTDSITGTPNTNIAKALDEGLADYHAYGATCQTPQGCNSNFLEPSLGAVAAEIRNFRSTAARCMDSSLRNAIGTMHVSQFSNQGLDYRLGTILAQALHRAATDSKRETMQRALIAAYDDQNSSSPGFRQLIDANTDTPGGFTLQAVLISILQHITDPDLKVATCNAFIDHFQIPKEFLTTGGTATEACPNSSFDAGGCPNL